MSTAPGAISPTNGRGGGEAPPLLRQTSIFRAVFFVVANLIGFVAVNAFLHYLATGRWLDFSADSYRKAVGAPLCEMLLHPLSVFDQPWMMVVGGLLVAAVVFVPIMVAVLYRLRVSALFVLAVAIIGHAPLLAGFLSAGCILAGRTRLRRSLPLLALLAGLSPVVVYLYFFSCSGEHALGPLQRLPVHMSFILALTAAVLGGVAVLALARLTQFRPGVIWPVLLVLLAAPVWLFYEKVGPAELDYALIAARVGPGDAIFSPPDADDAHHLRQTTSRPGSRPTSREAPKSAALLERVRMNLERQRASLLAECRKFIERYPDSPRAPAVMWIMAAAKDVRVDSQAFSAGFVKYRCGGPSVESRVAWAVLAERYPRSPQAFVAGQRQGIQAIRDGRAKKAWEHLRTAQALLMTHLGHQSAESSAGRGEIFIPTESLPGEEYYRKVLAETDRIIWLMESNKVLDDAKNADAFRDYMMLWPFAGAKSEDLQELAGLYQDTELSDNFRLQAALAKSDPLDRAMELAETIKEAYKTAEKTPDAAIAANYELGCLALRLGKTPAWLDMSLKDAEHYFGVVKSAQQNNPYLAAAEQYLASLAGRKETVRP